MSLQRMMLRALACVALQQQEDDALSPTMAEDRVFDSRLDPLIFKEFQSHMPGIIVYTDDDEGALINRGSGGGPYQRLIDLRVELVIGSFDSEIIDKEEHIGFAVPTTDAEMEARLDLFEQQVKWALYQLPRVYSVAFAQFVVRLESISSHATRDESGNNKHASRRMHFKCVINDDCPPNVGALAPGDTPPDLIPFKADLAKYPAPWIAPMLEAMYAAPSMRAVLSVLSDSNNPIAYLPLLKKIGINVDASEVENLLELPDE